MKKPGVMAGPWRRENCALAGLECFPGYTLIADIRKALRAALFPSSIPVKPWPASLQTRSRVIAWLLSAALILASESKTGLVTFVMLLAVRQMRVSATRAVLAVALAIAVLLTAYFLGLIPLASLYIRLDQYSAFFASLTGGGGKEQYADNAYIQLWIELGLPAALAYVFVLAYCAARDKLDQPLWLIFAAASLTTNLPYLFPLAYIFWFYVGRQQTPNPKIGH